MSRSKRPLGSSENDDAAGPKPVSLAEYIRGTQESCRHGECCRDQAALLAAYAQYVNDPGAPWNKKARSRRVGRKVEG